MRITILAFGSRGDVQPYVALGLGLQRAGHDVLLITTDDFEDFVTGRGLKFHSLGFDIQRDVMETPAMRDALETGRNTARAVSGLVQLGMPIADSMMESALGACQDADAIIGSTVGSLLGYHIAVKQNLPFFHANPFLAPTRMLPSPLFPFQGDLGGMFTALSHTIVDQFLWLAFYFPTRRWRRLLELPPMSPIGYPLRQRDGQPVPHLYGHSPAVIPHPPDWSEHFHVTGYWFLDHVTDWQPPADLVAFLDAGSPPVYVGFGSMSNRDPEQTTRIVLEALAKSGQRGVISTGWGGLGDADLPEGVFKLSACPHDWLFPQMAAVVHHGGAGTTAAGLRAGVPTIVVPFFGDQPFWGERVRALGVGPEPIPRQVLTADSLAYAMRIATTHEPMRQRAAELGEKIRAEDGVANAVQIIEGYVGA